MESRLISSGKRSNRNSNIEILRIISMVLIVAHHYAIHGFSMPNLPVIKNKVVVEFLFAGGKLGVNCFILISAYFLVNRKFSGKRLLKTTGAAWFYSVACLILFLTVFELCSLLTAERSLNPSSRSYIPNTGLLPTMWD